MKFYNEFSNKKAFSMAEILIALAVLAAIAAIIMPGVLNEVPKKEEQLHKKMNYIVEQVVSQMYYDDTMYTKKLGYENLAFANTERAVINGRAYEGDTKFCELFASKFNRISTVNCNPSHINEPTFTSSEGVQWTVPKTTFANGAPVRIKIDVNGENRGNNCTIDINNAKNQRLIAKEKDPIYCSDGRVADIFYYYVKPNGTVTYSDPITGSVQGTYKLTLTIQQLNQDGELSYGTTGEVSNTCIDATANEQYGTGDVGTGYGTPGDNPPQEEGTEPDPNVYGAVELRGYKIETGETTATLAKVSSVGKHTIRCLKNNSYYKLSAVPSDNQKFTDWQGNSKIIRVSNGNLTTKIQFTKMRKYNINLNIIYGGNESDITKLISTPQIAPCSYQALETRQNVSTGIYEKLNNFGNFEFIGTSIPNGEDLKDNEGNYKFFKYACLNNPTPMKADKDNKRYYTENGLETGEYRITFSTKPAYRIHPGQKEQYSQNVKMGSNELNLNVEIRNKP